MIRNISIGIDVGSYTTKVIVGEFLKGEKAPKIIGVGEAPTFGLRHGYVVNSDLVTASVKNAVSMAEKSSNLKIKRAFVAISGTSLGGEIGSGSAIISKADGEVTNLDTNKALEDCEDNLNLGNKKIIHVYPLSFKLDGKDVIGRLEGMRGTKLEARALFITYSIVHLEDLLGAIAEAGVEAIGVVASPVALSNISLSEKQKIVGVALVNIGDQTTSLSVFENGQLVSVRTFSLGSADITNDLALGFKTTLEEAENLKLGRGGEEFSQRKRDEIIEARLCDIFESVDNHLKKIKRSGLLPAGIVFVGGGAHTARLAELSKSLLKLPSTIGSTDMFGALKTKLRDPLWFVALGLLSSRKDTGEYIEGSVGNILKDIKNAIKSGFKQLLP